MPVLYFLENIRNPVLDAFFSAITHLGSETFFLAAAIITFWCFSKKGGYYLMTVGFVNTILNQFLKLLCRVPRPWVKDPNFTIVESARADATGYSFPSGHTASVVSTLGSAARMCKVTWFRVISIVFIALTAISRMYLGVHTPADVGVSLVIGTVLVFAVYPLFEKMDEKPVYMYFVLAGLTIISLAYLLFVELKQWPADMDSYNLEHGIKNAYTLFGCTVGMFLSYHIESKYVKFDTKAPWWAQILKTLLGLAIVLGIKAGLKPLLLAVFDGHVCEAAVRYFVIVVFAALIWPMSFKWFAGGCRITKK